MRSSSCSSFRMLFRAGCGVLLVGLSALTGCDHVPSEFSYSEATSELMPAAETAVKKTLDETFGTPEDPTIPHYFPVDRGGTVVTIEDFPEDAANAVLLEATDEELNLPQSAQFLFDPEDAFDVRMEAAEEELPNPLAELIGLKATSFAADSNLLQFNTDLPDVELIEPGLEIAIDPNHKLKQASQLYAQHCLHCHGVTGDGNGPTAQFMQPPPRDYRAGIFKFTSTGPQDKISTADLKYVLEEGIPGTYMPSFNMLPDEQLNLLVDYVKFLSMRGETEKNLNIEVGLDFSKVVLEEELEDVEDPEERKEIEADFEEELQEFLTFDYPEIALYAKLDLAEAWENADDESAVLYPSIARPDPNAPSLANPEVSSIENGRLLYLSKDAQCASCHGDTGRGNGYQTFQFQKKQDGSLYEVVGLHDAWGNPLEPRNLTTGIYRGGRRPIDVFRRIYAGIKGTPMPVFGGRGLSDEQIWDIVNYLLTMPQG
ncbi:MAG: c-type cytochrome [Rubinisphaera brasiliensis]|uniref:c-type cytochrome n=1 Tax=Rubinisphaera brasiliensis TaxID=119 RepID=UPI00391D5322